MGKGRFVNQKLGKNVSRKLVLLKSELAGRANRKPSPRSQDFPASKKDRSRVRPQDGVEVAAPRREQPLTPLRRRPAKN